MKQNIALKDKNLRKQINRNFHKKGNADENKKKITPKIYLVSPGALSTVLMSYCS
jgi:hypothetical protein